MGSDVRAGLVFAVDGIDGLGATLQRQALFPAIDGVLLDSIIDYLTYVFIPAFACSNRPDGWLDGWAAIIITFASDVLRRHADAAVQGQFVFGLSRLLNMVVL